MLSMGWGGGQKFTKFATLVQFYKLSMFPCFIISDAYCLVNCKLNSVLWPSLRCNEYPVCRNLAVLGYLVKVMSLTVTGDSALAGLLVSSLTLNRLMCLNSALCESQIPMVNHSS